MKTFEKIVFYILSITFVPICMIIAGVVVTADNPNISESHMMIVIFISAMVGQIILELIERKRKKKSKRNKL